MIETIGWLGSILFAFCAAPQCIMSIRQGHSNGVSSLLLIMWGTGEILSIAYVLLKHGIDLPLLFNYLMNIIFVSVIMFYKFLPRKINE
jgi:uncharacterized protein with PQ loop repeat